jgi:hypothetical protein
MNKKDFVQWQWMNTANAVVSIINSRSYKREPYYILLKMDKGYNGPPAYSHQQGHALKTIKVEGKKVIHQTVAILDYDPGPRLGTIVWRIDNRIGEVKMLWSLPPDKPFPVEDSENYGPIVEKVAKEATIIKDAIKWN